MFFHGNWFQEIWPNSIKQRLQSKVVSSLASFMQASLLIHPITSNISTSLGGYELPGVGFIGLLYHHGCLLQLGFIAA